METISSEQIRAARAMLRWEQKDLAEASGISLPAIKRIETSPGTVAAQDRTIKALRSALEAAGIVFVAENGEGNGVKLRKVSRGMTAAQCRAARGLLGWSQEQLAHVAKVERATIADFELGNRAPDDRTLAGVVEAIEAAGVLFVAENGEGPGVRLRKVRADNA